MSRWFSICIFVWIFSGWPTGDCLAQSARLDGAFVWVGGGNASWSQNKWAQELAWMRQIDMDTIIVSASVNETAAVYPTAIDGFYEIGSQPLFKILTEADAAEMDVYLGLLLTGQWWSDTSAAFLDSLTERSNSIASELYARYSSHESLRGFYITQEIDNLNWVQEPVRQRLVQRFLKPVSDHIKSLDPSLVVCTAPFFNTDFQQPPEYRTWWMQTLAETAHLDLIIPQDGIGVHHAQLPDVVEYFTALKEACDAHERQLWSDLEVFDRVSGGGQLEPASIERIVSQLAVQAPLVDRFVCWEFLGYLSPARSNASLELFIAYLNYLNGNDTLGLISLRKDYEFSAPPSPQYPDSGGLLTDGQAHFIPSAQVGWDEPDSVSVTIDLETPNEGILGFRAAFYRSATALANVPSSVSVSLSANGETFTPAGHLEWLVGEDRAMNIYSLLLAEPAAGRYARFDFNRSEGALLCAELGVYSTQFEEPIVSELLSEGKPYSLSRPPASQYPDAGRQLTDGDISYTWDAQVGWQNPESEIGILLDLQQQYSIDRVEAYFMRSDGSAVRLPEEVTVSLSADGTDFYDFRQATPESLEDDNINRFIAVNSASGRFVRVTVSPDSSWLMLCEIKVFGTEIDGYSGWLVR
jgi:hypothetical protein